MELGEPEALRAALQSSLDRHLYSNAAFLAERLSAMARFTAPSDADDDAKEVYVCAARTLEDEALSIILENEASF